MWCADVVCRCQMCRAGGRAVGGTCSPRCCLLPRSAWTQTPRAVAQLRPPLLFLLPPYPPPLPLPSPLMWRSHRYGLLSPCSAELPHQPSSTSTTPPPHTMTCCLPSWVSAHHIRYPVCCAFSDKILTGSLFVRCALKKLVTLRASQIMARPLLLPPCVLNPGWSSDQRSLHRSLSSEYCANYCSEERFLCSKGGSLLS